MALGGSFQCLNQKLIVDQAGRFGLPSLVVRHSKNRGPMAEMGQFCRSSPDGHVRFDRQRTWAELWERRDGPRGDMRPLPRTLKIGVCSAINCEISSP